MKGEDITEQLLDLAVRILKLVEALPRTVAGRNIAGQLIRCGTGAGSNFEEARGGESRADFIHKMGIAWKEVRETGYWLRLIHRGAMVKPNRVESLLKETDELTRILAKSIQTARRKES